MHYITTPVYQCICVIICLYWLPDIIHLIGVPDSCSISHAFLVTIKDAITHRNKWVLWFKKDFMNKNIFIIYEEIEVNVQPHNHNVPPISTIFLSSSSPLFCHRCISTCPTSTCCTPPCPGSTCPAYMYLCLWSHIISSIDRGYMRL